MALSKAQEMFMSKVHDAMHYCSTESDLTVLEAVGALEIVKLDLMHKHMHLCKRCGERGECPHCKNPHP